MLYYLFIAWQFSILDAIEMHFKFRFRFRFSFFDLEIRTKIDFRFASFDDCKGPNTEVCDVTADNALTMPDQLFSLFYFYFYLFIYFLFVSCPINTLVCRRAACNI